MKTTRSAFTGFPRDRYTTLAETDDRLMATKITAIWRYGSPDLDFDAACRGRAGDAARGLRRPRQPVGPDLDLDHGQGDARAHEEVDEVRMVLPNLHHWLGRSATYTSRSLSMPNGRGRPSSDADSGAPSAPHRAPRAARAWPSP